MNKTQTYSLFTDFDINLFKAGKHFKLYEKFGAHKVTLNGQEGIYFSVWAPTAKKVSVVGDFNFWNDAGNELFVRWDSSGIWEGFIPNAKVGMRYKYKIVSNNNDIVTEKADPYALYCEHPPQTASIIWDISDYKWDDKKWLGYRKDKNDLDKPYAVYEVHLDSWRKNENGDRLTYKQLATELVNYVKDMDFTHVEFMPIMEYPYDPSWGYLRLGTFSFSK